MCGTVWSVTRSSVLGLLGLFLLTALYGCATVPPRSDIEAYNNYKQTHDPAEPFNRATTKFNRGLEIVIFKPVATLYQAILPRFVRKAVSNFVRNIDTPVVLVNDMLQGQPKRAGITLSRFLANSTAGLGGLIDVGEKIGLPYHMEDFGQTLAVWGMSEGPYLVLPLLGPSNTRDGIGFAVDAVSDPLFWIVRIKDLDGVRFGRPSLEAVDKYATHLDLINDLRRNSIDYYAALRSAYRQNRDDEIRNGAPPSLDEFDYDVSDDINEPASNIPPPSTESGVSTSSASPESREELSWSCHRLF